MWMSSLLAGYLFAPDSSEQLTVLVALSHPSWAGTQRLTIGESVTSGGYLYRSYPMDIRLPEASHDGVRPGELVMAARPDIVGMFRGVSSPITVDVSLVFLSTPDTPVRLFPRGAVRKPRVEADRITADLVWPAWAESRLPRARYTPGDIPGLF